MLPAFQPLAVIPRQYPFDGSDWVFELKHHGFRALAYLSAYEERGSQYGAKILQSPCAKTNWDVNLFPCFPVLQMAWQTQLV
jgi:hypothetical protein